MTIKNNGVLSPCCAWVEDEEWKKENHYTQIYDIKNWHKSPQILEKRKMLESGIWPENCIKCQKIEEAGNYSSMRGNGNNAYHDYNEEDITLDIWPGSVCNFACQTCGPESSSRIRNFMHKAGMIDKKTVDISSLENFDFLYPIKDRIKDVSVLGGEPFYDKNCLKFLKWSEKNINARIIIFTNGLYINYDFIENCNSKLVIVFSIDAIGKPADYIRYGSHWEKVKENYFKVKKYSNVEVRVNVTTSVYNFCYLKELIDFFKSDWPSVLSFSYADEGHLQPNVVPIEKRPLLIKSLEKIPYEILKSDIREDQKRNTINAIVSIINKLKHDTFNLEQYTYLCSYIEKMDRVKKISIKSYCPELYEILFSNNSSLINYSSQMEKK